MRPACRACRVDGSPLEFIMAFQPIVDAEASTVWGYEALVRGPNGEPAPTVLSQVTDENRYRFDQACRVKAIDAAGRLFGDPKLKLSINFLPNAVYEPAACIRTSLAAADRAGLSRSQLMFEFTENERMSDGGHVTPHRRGLQALRFHDRDRRFRQWLRRHDSAHGFHAGPDQDRHGAGPRHR